MLMNTPIQTATPNTNGTGAVLALAPGTGGPIASLRTVDVFDA